MARTKQSEYQLRNKEQDISLPVLDELVNDYVEGVLSQTSGAWATCDAMREALMAGDVDSGLAAMRDVCPSALEDVRLMFRAKKQKFVELLRAGGNAEAALACARAELAPLALDAYPEAYSEFKRLLMLLLLQQRTGSDGQAREQADAQRAAADAVPGPGLSSSGGGAAGAVAGIPGAGVEEFELSVLWDHRSTAEFADLAYFTVRSMLGLQHPLLGLQLRYLLRLHAEHPPPHSSPSGATAAELAERLRVPQEAGPARDPPPLPPASAGGRAGGGGGPPGFPEADVQAVIHGAGTSRAAALDALRHAGGDAYAAFRSEVGRLRLDDRLVAELALEYGRFRGLLDERRTAALERRAAADPSQGGASTSGGSTGGEEPGPSSSPHSAGCSGDGSGGGGGGGGPVAAEPLSAAGPGRPLGPGVTHIGPRGGATGGSPPAKVARRSPPIDMEIEAEPEAGAAAGTAAAAQCSGSGRQTQGQGQGQERGAQGGDGPAAVGPSPADAAAAAEGPGGSGDGGGGGGGDGVASTSQPRGAQVLAELLRLAQAGDAGGVLSLVDRADPGLWAEQPGLLFDLRRCQYGALLREGKVAEALELARRELTPLADAHPHLLPALKAAMAALLPPLPQPPADAGADGSSNAGSGDGGGDGSGAAGSGDGCGASGLLPSLRNVAAAIQAALQPRLGLQGPRLVRLMEGLLVSHRIWLRVQRLPSDRFAGPMRLNDLRLHQPAAAAAASPSGAAAAAAAGGAAAPPPPPPPRHPHVGGSPPRGIAAASRALQRLLQEQGHLPGPGAAAAAAAGVPPPLAAALGGGPLAHPLMGMPPWYEEQLLLNHLGLAPPGGDPMGGFDFAGAGGGAGVAMDEDVSSDEDDDGGAGGGDGGELGAEVEVDEEGVLQLMEVLELPRGAAIEMLARFGGDVTAAVLSVMS